MPNLFEYTTGTYGTMDTGFQMNCSNCFADITPSNMIDMTYHDNDGQKPNDYISVQVPADDD